MFSVTLQKESDGVCLVILSGAILEDAKVVLQDLLPKLAGAEKVAFDFENVSLVNSSGSRTWFNFLNDVRKSHTFEFRKCSVFFIDTINLLPDLVRGGTIASFYMPFDCRSCAKSTSLLFESDAIDRKKTFTNVICPKCGSVMVPSVSPSDYLDFLDYGSRGKTR